MASTFKVTLMGLLQELSSSGKAGDKDLFCNLSMAGHTSTRSNFLVDARYKNQKCNTCPFPGYDQAVGFF